MCENEQILKPRGGQGQREASTQVLSRGVTGLRHRVTAVRQVGAGATVFTGGVRAPLRLSAIYVFGFALVGMLSAMLGPSLITLSRRTGSTLSSLGILFTLDSFGSACGSLLAGFLLNRWFSTHVQVIAALLVLAAITVILPFAGTVPVLAPLWFLTGLAKTFLIVTVNTLFVWIHRNDVGPKMNVADFCLGTGSLVMPLLIGWSLAATGQLEWAYWAVTACSLALLGSVLTALPGPRITTPPRPEDEQSGNWAKVVAIALLLFLYVGAEVSAAGWVPSYALDHGFADAASGASFYTSLFWLALTVGRLLWIPVARRLKPATCIWAGILLALLGILLIVTRPDSRLSFIIGVVWFGTMISSVFPSAFSYLSTTVGITGRVSGTVLFSSSVGAMFFPWLTGVLFAFEVT